MKPVYQKIISSDHGDCYSACLSSITELDVPNFHTIEIYDEKHNQNIDYFEHKIEWLRKNGYSIISFYDKKWEKFDDIFLLNIYTIASVPSQKFKNCMHAVIIQLQDKHNGSYEWTFVHDPNPENDIAKYKLEDINRVDFIIKN